MDVDRHVCIYACKHGHRQNCIGVCMYVCAHIYMQQNAIPVNMSFNQGMHKWS